MGLLVSLLGEQVVRDESTGAALPCSSRSLALLAHLVTHAGRPQSRQRIAALLWPESSDAQALTNLRRELHHLRRTLDEDLSLVVTARELCWQDSDTCRVDVRTFDTEARASLALVADEPAAALTHATAALAAYGGELLPAGYDDWVLELRAALARQCVQLCDLTARAARRTGRLSTAVEAMWRRIQLQPLEEVGIPCASERSSSTTSPPNSGGG